VTLLAALLAGLAVAVLLRRSGDHRLQVVVAGPARPAVSVPVRRPLRRPPLPHVACWLAGAATAAVLPLAAGVVAGLAVALLGPRLLVRLEPSAVRREREQLLVDLPLLLDLLAACLAGGAPLASAASAVARALPGPAGRRAAAVGAALAVGCPPGEAWQALAAAGPDDPLAPAARALARAADGGAPVAAAVARLAADARLDARARGEQAARRVGVVAVAPLGLCFLPAFVLLGIVPVVVGLAAPLLATF
jgi:pilus assembly protein TadC